MPCQTVADMIKGKKFDTEFVKVDLATLCDLIRAADYLNIKRHTFRSHQGSRLSDHRELQDLTCQTVADMIKGKKSDAKFIKVDHAIFFDLIRAADYLNIKSLLDLTCQTVADLIKKKYYYFQFVNVDQATLLDFILAANYLNIKSLLDLTCQTVVDMIKGKNFDELDPAALIDLVKVADYLNIKSLQDLTCQTVGGHDEGNDSRSVVQDI
ncbi:hypothetical protein F0562_020211 [Nyssa sinensis]|uniref:SKP1 component dimerisation domain-containing protein n=1 Tax=Nyssa sinensis TaxID=561372 RepID=A0A5J5BUI1_9ASTE|nr:hypothetical protein F0562_020211 [Nyssa sinensis]